MRSAIPQLIPGVGGWGHRGQQCVQQSLSMPPIRDMLTNNNLTMKQSKDDEHCLFYSFVSSWNNQLLHYHDQHVTTDEVIQKCHSELVSNFAFYEFFVDTESIQLHLYLNEKNTICLQLTYFHTVWLMYIMSTSVYSISRIIITV